jgi:hypothetical protein
MGELLISHLWTWFNLSDFLTKVTNGAKRRRLIGNVLYDIYNNHTYKIGKTSRSSSLETDLEGTEEMCPRGGSNPHPPAMKGGILPPSGHKT